MGPPGLVLRGLHLGVDVAGITRNRRRSRIGPAAAAAAATRTGTGRRRGPAALRPRLAWPWDLAAGRRVRRALAAGGYGRVDLRTAHGDNGPASVVADPHSLVLRAGPNPARLEILLDGKLHGDADRAAAGARAVEAELPEAPRLRALVVLGDDARG